MALVIKENKLHCKGKTCKRGILHISAALKHIINSEECKKEYTAEQIDGIRYLSGRRTKQKDLKRRRENYDSAKRKAKYQKEKSNREPTAKKETKKKVEDEPCFDSNQILMEHKFVVIVESVTLKNEKPTECTIRHSYPLFGNEEFISSTFSLKSGTKGDEENGLDLWEHIVMPQDFKEAEVRRFLTDNPFEIQLFTEENYLGNAKIQLSRIYDPTSQRRNQQSFKEELEIKSSSDVSIGTMGFFFILVTENCIRCKGKTCKKEILKMSTALKHITQSKSCKKEYTADDIQELRSQSKKRKNKNDINRQREKYDPKKRSKKHVLHTKKKEAEVKRFHEENDKNRIINLKEDLPKKLISINSRGIRISMEVFQKRVAELKKLKLSNKTLRAIDDIEENLNQTNKYFEIEINKAIEKGKDISSLDKSPEETLYRIYSSQLANVQKDESFLKRYDYFRVPRCMILDKWCEICLENDKKFKAIAMKRKAPFTEYKKMVLLESLYNDEVLPDANKQKKYFFEK